MREIMNQIPQLDERAAATFADAMRQIARCDGDHPQELALIEQMEAALVEPVGGAQGAADLASVNTPALREAFLKTLVLVAFADGEVSRAERDIIADYADRLGLSDAEVSRTVLEVAQVLISQFSGVRVFKDRIVELGQRMGLSDADIQAALDS